MLILIVLTSAADLPNNGHTSVLAVDDDNTQLLITKLSIEQVDNTITVETAESPIEALKLLGERPYECIVSDYLMPGMDGVELCLEIRKTSNIPFILYTGQGSEEVAEAAFRAGVDDYVRKESALSHYGVLAKRIRHSVDRHRLEDIYKAGIEGNHEGVALIQGTRFVYANPAMASLLGEKGAEDLVGKDITGWLSETDRETVVSRALSRQNGGREANSFTYHVRRSDGEARVMHASAVLINYMGRPTSLVFNHDDTDQVKGEEARRESEERYKHIYHNFPIGIYEIAFRPPKVVSANEALCRYIGYSEEELRSMDPFEILDEDSGRRFRERIARAQSGEQIEDSMEYLGRRKDGSVVSGLLSIRFNRVGSRVTGALVAVQDTTERRRAENKLREAGEALRHERDLLQSVMNGARRMHLVYLDRDFNFVRVNESYAETCGYTPEEMVGRNHFALYPGEEIEAIFKKVRETGEAVFYHDKPFEFPDQLGRGVTYWDWTLEPVKSPDGSVDGLVFSLVETTERVRAEAALREGEERYRQLVETNTDFIWEMDAGGRYTYCSPQMERLWGIKPEDMIGRTPFDVMPPEDREQGLEAFASFTNPPKPFKGLVTRSFDAEGHPIVVESSGVPLFRDGVLAGFRGVTRDVTESKRAKEEVEKEFEQLVTSEEELAVSNRELSASNERFASINEELQASEEELRTLNEQLNASQAELASSNVELNAMNRELKNSHNRLAESNEELRAAREDLSKYAADLESIVGSRTAELEEVSRRLRYFMDSATEGFSVYDRDLNLVDANRVVLERLGQGTNLKDVVGRNIRELYPGFEDSEWYAAYRRVLETGEEFHADAQPGVGAYSGRLLSASVFRVGDGLGVVFRDVSRRVRLEKELREAQRGEDIDRLSAMVAHDIRNPLNTAAQAMQMAKLTPEKAAALTDLAEKSVGRAIQMIEDLRENARVIAPMLQRVSLGALIEDTVREKGLPSGVEVDVRYDESLGLVSVDASLFRRVLENLLQNAAEAMPGGGRVTVRASRVGEVVNVAVADRGVGIPDEAKARIFTPLYTSKAKGVGLGLSFCKRAVEALGGSIGFTSKVGEGTTFTVSLPTQRPLTT